MFCSFMFKVEDNTFTCQHHVGVNLKKKRFSSPNTMTGLQGTEAIVVSFFRDLFKMQQVKLLK